MWTSELSELAARPSGAVLAQRARRDSHNMPSTDSDTLPRPNPVLPPSWGTEDHRRRSKALRERLSLEGARSPRMMPRVDANGSAAPPPPPWFTFAAAVVPAIPCVCFVPPSVLLMWHPVWVASFYLLPRPVPQLSPMLILCFVVIFRALVHQGWESWAPLLLLTSILGFSMHLAESALWDTVEPFLMFGMFGFGAGRQSVKTRSSASGRGDPLRVTAASSVLAGDPTRARLASAFTQAELDALAAHGIKPWDPEAQAALKSLGW